MTSITSPPPSRRPSRSSRLAEAHCARHNATLSKPTLNSPTSTNVMSDKQPMPHDQVLPSSSAAATRKRRRQKPSEGDAVACDSKRSKTEVVELERKPRTVRDVSVASTSTTTAGVSSNDDASASSHRRRNASRDRKSNAVDRELRGLLSTAESLQDPASVATKCEGRKLRSQDCARYKSELSAYFPEYNEVIGNVPKTQNLIEADMPILLTSATPSTTTLKDMSTSYSHLTAPSPPSSIVNSQSEVAHEVDCILPESFPIRSYPGSLFTNLVDCQEIDFGFLDTRHDDTPGEDPLPDCLYDSAHRKAERNEKSIRNSERERAQHEKNQIIRLLDSLLGHDWLRVMGVNGVTASRKKEFEPARKYFIQGCQAILDKFARWISEEKRLKVEQEHAHSTKIDALLPEKHVPKAASSSRSKATGVRRPAQSTMSTVKTTQKTATTNPAADADAPKRETQKMTKWANSTKKAKDTPAHIAEPSSAQDEHKEFVSFFTDPHRREAALNPKQRRGRTVLAWGHPIVEIEQRDFELPSEYRDLEFLRAHARWRRQHRRQLQAQKAQK